MVDTLTPLEKAMITRFSQPGENDSQSRRKKRPRSLTATEEADTALSSTPPSMKKRALSRSTDESDPAIESRKRTESSLDAPKNVNSSVGTALSRVKEEGNEAFDRDMWKVLQARKMALAMKREELEKEERQLEILMDTMRRTN